MEFDEIGYWSEIKLEILKKYSEEYTRILKNHPYLRFYYIDAFAGAGIHRKKKTGELVPGSPRNALDLEHKFEHYYFIDLNKDKIEFLKNQFGNFPNVGIILGNSNDILPKDIFPLVQYKDRKRALCFLDPYTLQLDWELVRQAGEMKSLEVFINFPDMSINRNVLRKKLDSTYESQIIKMNTFFGGDWWKDFAYENDLPDLFGQTTQIRKGISPLIEEYGRRLKEIAGFKFVPKPISMKNNSGAILYHIFFATQNETGHKIVSYLFNKYRKTGIV